MADTPHIPLRTPSPIVEWLRSKLQLVVYKLDNSGDTTIEHNGELHLIRTLCGIYEHAHPFVVFDIGSNYGEYADLIRQHHRGQLVMHLFEPQKTCVAALEKKFGNDSRVQIRHYGLSDEEGTATLHKNSDGSGLASLYRRELAHYHVSFENVEKISLKRGDSYIKQHAIKHVHLIKIDVEGHEVSVLKGFGEFISPENVDVIQFEYGGANIDSRTSLLELATYFNARGFVLAKIMRRGLEKREYVPRLENFVYQNWVAISPRVTRA
jgi:FkbM family methyltransferase